MVFLYIVALALIGCHVQGAAIQSSDSINPSQRLSNFISKKCLENANETVKQEALDEFSTLRKSCWGSVILRTPATPEERTAHCHAHKTNIVDCLNSFSTKFSPCLSADEVYLKEFLVEAFEKYSSYFCNSLNTLIPRGETPTRKCTSTFSSNPDKDPHKICYARSSIFGDDPTVDVITKKELCSDLKNINTCYEELFNKHCPDATELKQSYLKMQEEGLTPCEDVQ